MRQRKLQKAIVVREFLNKIKSFFTRKLSKRAFYIWMALILIFGLLFAYGIYRFNINPYGQDSFINGSEEEEDNRVQSPLNGVKVSPEVAKLRPYAVIIENHVDSRPQSSLTEASIVYEALVEGGITRFMALYLENRPSEIGPIRSVRDYYIDWFLETKAFCVHAGGSKDALMRIAKDKDILDLKHSKTYFWRSGSRYSPHNLYSSYDKLKKYAQKKKYSLSTSYESGDFKEELSLDKRPESQTPITINFSKTSYKVTYSYDSKTNSYLRDMVGKPHVDAVSKKQIIAKVVVVQFVSTAFSGVDPDKGLLDISTVGEGKVLIFQDGGVVEGIWSKSGVESRTKFYDSAGNIIKINPGQHWFEIVKTDTQVSY